MTDVLDTIQSRELIVADHQVPIVLTQQLSSYLPPEVFGYEWFSPDYERLAIECVQTIDVVIVRQSPERLKVFTHMLVDLYNRDRAQRANFVLSGNPHLPCNTRNIEGYVSRWQHGKIVVTEIDDWVVGVPPDRFHVIARIERETWPDAYYLATIVQTTDPFLFARYGVWFVELARWE